MSIELLTDFTLPDVQLPVEVILGRPEKGCPGHGICRLERREQWYRATGGCLRRPRLNADFQYFVPKRFVRLVFSVNELKSDPYWVAAHDGFFPLEEPHLLSAGLREACGLSAGAFFSTGYYEVSRSAATRSVDLPVSGKPGMAELEIRKVIRESQSLPRYLTTFVKGALLDIRPPGTPSPRHRRPLAVSVSREEAGRVTLHFHTGLLTTGQVEACFPGGFLHLPRQIRLADEDAPRSLRPGKYPVLSLPGQQLVSLPLESGLRHALSTKIQED